jgi:hypothetical protein
LYDINKTRISLGVLIEANEALRQYRDSHILAGGWAPYFITKGYFDHCGSLDIDLVVRPRIFKKYESIRDSIVAAGFEPTASPFRFKRNIADDFSIELDFLSEPQALKDIPKKFIRVQEGLDAFIIPGSSIVFKFNFETEASGKLLDGSELSTRVMVADIVSMVGMKAHALGRPLKLDKDCYDLYAICGFAEGGPSDSAKEFTKKVRRKLVKREKVFLQEALARTREYLQI